MQTKASLSLVRGRFLSSSTLKARRLAQGRPSQSIATDRWRKTTDESNWSLHSQLTKTKSKQNGYTDGVYHFLYNSHLFQHHQKVIHQVISGDSPSNYACCIAILAHHNGRSSQMIHKRLISLCEISSNCRFANSQWNSESTGHVEMKKPGQFQFNFFHVVSLRRQHINSQFRS